MQETQIPSLGWRDGYGNPLQYSCLENFQGHRILVYYSPWGCKESDTTEQLTHTKSHYRWGRLMSHTHTHTRTHTHRKSRYTCGPSIHLYFPPTPIPISFPLPLMVYFNRFTNTCNLNLFYFEALSLSVLWPQARFAWDCSLRLPLHWGEFPHDIHVRLFPFGSFHLSPLFPWLRFQQWILLLHQRT